MSLPTDPKARKNAPVARGVIDYFPDALVAVAELSRIGNEQHNPGQPMHWAKEKSTDHADCIVRHLMERGTVDTDGVRHSVKVAWRALALLQVELDAVARPDAGSEVAGVQAESVAADYPSRWEMICDDGKRWATTYRYTRRDLGQFSSAPLRRLPD